VSWHSDSSEISRECREEAAIESYCIDTEEEDKRRSGFWPSDIQLIKSQFLQL
jgi:hypothetical protein